AAFVERGVDPGRVELQPATTDHLATYDRCDIALDTFPYSGMTTTCEGLWMGLPVITMPGPTHVSRTTASYLSTSGLPELIGGSHSQFITIAQRLVGDAARVCDLRAGMRERVRRSPLHGASRFTRGLENAYRQMWHARCPRQE